MTEAHLIILARHEIVTKYCEEKGWDMEDLTIEQILEIRNLEEWKNPLKGE